MKKSTMVMNMASELILNLIHYGIDLDYGKAQEVADKLLTRQEKAGMLPPERHRTPIMNQSCEWEPEND